MRNAAAASPCLFPSRARGRSLSAGGNSTLALGCILGLLILCRAPGLIPRAHAADEDVRFAQAEKLFEEKSYKAARKIYQELAQGDLAAELRGPVLTHLARCHEKLRDRTALEGLQDTFSDLDFPWNARSLVVAGRVATKTRGSWEKLELLTQALDLLDAHKPDSDGKWPDLDEEWVDGSFDLIEGLCGRWRYDIDRQEWEKKYHRENPEEIEVPYEVWAAQKGRDQDELRRQRILEIYEAILARSVDSDRNSRALLERGMLRLTSIGDPLGGQDFALPNAKEFLEALSRNPEAALRREALAEWLQRAQEAIADWQQLIERSPNEERADDASFLIAFVTESYFSDLVRAAELYQTTLRQYPESQWAGNCSSRIDTIRRESLELDGSDVHATGEVPVYELTARNVKTVLCRLYPVDSLLNYVEPGRFLKPADFAISDEEDRISWEIETGCGEDHKQRTVSLVVPEKRPGSYLLRVSGQDSQIETLVVISDLALTLQTSEDEAVAWVTSAITGEPRPNVPVLFRVDSSKKKEWSQKTQRMVTDAQGIARWRYQPNEPTEQRSVAYVSAAAESAQHGALARHTNNWPDDERTPKWVYYLETDRPVYRPGQTVHYKLTVRYWSGETYSTPKRKTAFDLEFKDPRRTEVLEETLATDEDGAISGTLTLPSDAALGMYKFRLRRDGKGINARKWDTRGFRVEEYRRPEFEVAIAAPADPVVIGDRLSVTVSAKFLSGEPVRAGEVRVRVTRTPLRFSYTPPPRHGWFQSPRNEYDYWGEEDVFSAEGVLDGSGEAVFSIPTAAFPDELDSNYQVSAWVTDSAEREQTSSKTLPITRSEFFAHLEPRLKIYSAGEALQIDVRTMRADQVGIATTGSVEVARRRDREEAHDGYKSIVTEWEKILELPFDTRDTATLFEETLDEQGEFRVTYRTKDRRGTSVEGSTRVWVLDREFTGRDYLLEGLEILTSAREYSIGDTSEVVILTRAQDAEILVLRSGGNKILDIRTVRAKGHVAQLSFPITEGETPNVHLSAWLVRNRDHYHAKAEILVPPTHKVLQGKLIATSSEVQPGEELELSFEVVDENGAPVAGQFSLALFDRALLSIQPEITLDPEQHFYGRKWDFNLEHSLSLDYEPPISFQWNVGSTPQKYRTRRLPSRMRSSWRYSFQYLVNAYGEFTWKDGGPTPREMERGLDKNDLVAGIELSSRARGKKSPQRGAPGGGVSAILDMGEDNEDAEAGEYDGDQAPLAAARTRSNFSETAVWRSRFVTNEDGRASCRVVMPDSLTSWQGIARGITRDGRVVHARMEVRTAKNILARLAAPRFFRERDEVVVSALARNNFDEAAKGELSLSFPASTLQYAGPKAVTEDGDRTTITFSIEIPAQGETSVDIPFRVVGHGATDVTLAVKTPRESDALQRTIQAHPYGLDRFVGGAGVAADLDGVSESSWTFRVPEESVEASRSLMIDVTPSPAIALVESLPYLVQYPYGCVEQTLHRFLPAAVVAKTLESTGVNLTEILPEKAAEIPAGYWGHLEQRPLELFRPEDLQRLIDEGSRQLQRQQNSNGSWGWWAGSPGDPTITALVVDAFATALSAGVELPPEPAQRGAVWLLNHLRSRNLRGEDQIYERPDFEEFALIGRAIFRIKGVVAFEGKGEEDDLRDLAETLYGFRDDLGAQGKALLAVGIAALDLPDDQRPHVLLRNLENHETRKPEWGTTQYGSARNYRNWYDSGVEATARVLEAFLTIAPDDERVPEMIRWLLENREGSHYDSTRSTAAVAFAIAQYLEQSGELDPELTAEVSLNGKPLATFQITRNDLFTQRFQVAVPANTLFAGEHRLEFRRTGRGNLYWSAALQFYSKQDPIPAGGNRMKLTRQYYRISERKAERDQTFLVNGKQQTRKVQYWERDLEPLNRDSVLRSGDRVLVEVEVEAANRFRYLIFEDRKPAGLEAVSVRSGYIGGVFSYREFRDDRVVHFSSRLPEGKHGFAYELRAERPGRFRALPVTGYAMYIPHVKANSEGSRIEVE